MPLPVASASAAMWCMKLACIPLTLLKQCTPCKYINTYFMYASGGVRLPSSSADAFLEHKHTHK